MTAFDSDIRVPLIVTGPGVPAGQDVKELTENIDLAPTFMRLAGVRPPERVDGHELVELMHGEHPRPWRQAVLIEHHHPEQALGDPDAQTKSTGNPPSYEAIRTRTGTFVEYATGEHEYYDLTNDPDELTNVYSLLSQEHREKLTSRLDSLEVCWGGPSCWWAATRPISR
jgi:arylsulfatase A-like enzyme